MNHAITPPTWVDTHCHLDMLDRAPAEAVAQANDMGVDLLITIGTQHQSNQAVAQITREFLPVYGAVGVHPHEADRAEDDDFAFITDEVKNNDKIIALGEGGFDYYYGHSSREGQKQVFYRLVLIALEFGLPLVIHARDADDAVREFLRDFKGQGVRGVFHSYTGNPFLAEEILQEGFYLSFNGICTFPKGENVREVLRMTPHDRLLLETDAPFLAPKPHRGRTNQPGYVSLVGEFVAEFLQLPPQEVKKMCFDNSMQLFQRLHQR